MSLCIAYRRCLLGTRCYSGAGASDSASETPIQLQNSATITYERTIVTTRPCVAGSSIITVAWPDALTAQDALQQLYSYESRGKCTLTHSTYLKITQSKQTPYFDTVLTIQLVSLIRRSGGAQASCPGARSL